MKTQQIKWEKGGYDYYKVGTCGNLRFYVSEGFRNFSVGVTNRDTGIQTELPGKFTNFASVKVACQKYAAEVK